MIQPRFLGQSLQIVIGLFNRTLNPSNQSIASFVDYFHTVAKRRAIIPSKLNLETAAERERAAQEIGVSRKLEKSWSSNG